MDAHIRTQLEVAQINAQHHHERGRQVTEDGRHLLVTCDIIIKSSLRLCLEKDQLINHGVMAKNAGDIALI